MAAPYAAATAALVIEFVRQNFHTGYLGIEAIEGLLRSPEGMRRIFARFAKTRKRGDFLRYLTPWHILRSSEHGLLTQNDQISADSEMIIRRIEDALLDLQWEGYNISVGHAEHGVLQAQRRLREQVESLAVNEQEL
jgi:hypothetical protein